MQPQSRKAVQFIFLVLILFSLFVIGGSVFASGREQQAQFVAPKLVANTSFLNIRTGPGSQYTVLVTVVGGTELPVLGVFADKVWYQVSTVVGVGWVNVQFTLPRGDFSQVPFAEAPPVVGGLVVQDSTLLGQGGGGALPGTTTASRTPASRPWGVSILGGDFHAEPTTKSRKLRQALSENRQTIYPLNNATFAEGTPWYQLTIPGTGTGWLMEQFVVLRPCGVTENNVAVITRGTGLVSGPDGTEAPAFGLDAGDEVYIVGLQEGLVKVEMIDGSTGWVSLEATVGRDNSQLTSFCTTVPTATTATGPFTTTTTVTGTTLNVPTASLVAPRVVINTAFLNIRSGPGSQFTVVSTVPGGSELPVFGLTRDGWWYLVQGTFGQGWVNKDFVLFRGDIDVVPIITNATGSLATPMAVVNGALTLYAAPNPTFGVVGAISGPAQVPVVARTADGAWVQLNTSVGFGWVPANQVTLTGDTGLIPVVAQ